MKSAARRGLRSSRLVGIGVLLVLAGCTPELDWRELRPARTGLALLLPCKPVHRVRMLTLAGREVAYTIDSCDAGDATWAVAYADLVEPQRMASALVQLRGAARTNLRAESVRTWPLQVPGMTPQAESVRSSLSGRLPDGTPVRQEMAAFARGTWIFQASVLGHRLGDDDVTAFFESLRFAP